MARQLRVAAVLGLSLLVGLGGLSACTRHKQRRLARDGGTTTAPVAPPSTVVTHPRGGSARVGVWGAPDVSAPTLGGAAVRSLVLPQLFVAQPDGTWAPSLVAPGSDRLARDERSVSFELRAGAAWSDGSPITAADLRRTADPRFVAGVDEGAGRGVRVRFTQVLPGWRRLWSGTDSVAAPREGVWGGPFVVAGATAGLETVLRRNDRWYGGPGPFLDELRLVLVPDATTARQLLGRGELDALMPLAATNRTPQFRGLPGVQVDTGPPPAGGWWMGLRLNPSKMEPDERAALVATVDRGAFVGTLLRDEASVLTTFAGTSPAPWSSTAAGDAGPLKSAGLVDLVGEVEEPMTALLQRSMQKRARAAGGTVELRNAEADRVEGWLREGTYGSALVVDYDGPVVCWTCRWASVDADLAHAADAAEVGAVGRLERRLHDDNLVLPLWRPRPTVAYRTGLYGLRSNPYGLSAAWNAWEWWRG